MPDGRIVVEFIDLSESALRSEPQQLAVKAGVLELLRRNLGHEIRNPLGGIRGAAQMLAAELADAEQAELARLVMREVDRIDELLARFGDEQLDRVTTDLHRLIDEVMAVIGAETESAMTIETDFDPSIPPLYVDGGQVRRVILNLLRNAWQAGARRVRLTSRIEHGVTLTRPEPVTAVRIGVEDDGGGVPDALRPLLFLPMVTGRRDGTGLGLSLSQQAAVAHGGLLRYEPLPAGSRFDLYLPLDTEA